MTAKRTWQKLEERVCAKFRGRRTPLSGSNSQHGTAADCIDCIILPEAYIEIKLRASFLHHALFRDAAAKAKKEGKIPLLVTHEKSTHGELVTLRLEDFLELASDEEGDTR